MDNVKITCRKVKQKWKADQVAITFCIITAEKPIFVVKKAGSSALPCLFLPKLIQSFSRLLQLRKTH